MATSRLALPLMITYSIVIWAANIAADITLWPCLIIFVISTYLMIELNNRNALMRQYSRMVSCSYISLVLMCPWIMRNMMTMAAQCCIIMTFTLLFMSYQDRSALGKKLWAYIFLGLASFVWPPLLILLPLFWIGEAYYLMSFSGRAWWASILGVLVPVWIAVPVIMYTESYDMVFRLTDYFKPSETFMKAIDDPTLFIPQQLSLPLMETLIIVFVLTLMVLGIVHYFRQSYTDKIHVRMLYQFFTLITVACSIIMALFILLPCNTQPAADVLCAIVMVCTAPLIAHYVTFSNTRLTNISVIILMLVVFIISAYQALNMIGVPNIL